MYYTCMNDSVRIGSTSLSARASLNRARHHSHTVATKTYFDNLRNATRLESALPSLPPMMISIHMPESIHNMLLLFGCTMPRHAEKLATLPIFRRTISQIAKVFFYFQNNRARLGRAVATASLAPGGERRDGETSPPRSTTYGRIYIYI